MRMKAGFAIAVIFLALSAAATVLPRPCEAAVFKDTSRVSPAGRSNAAAVYEEPLTGTVITFPEAFAGGEVNNYSDHTGKVYSITAGGDWQNYGGQIEVSVRETGAASIADVLKNLVSYPEETGKYDLLELSENTLEIFTERESFGDKIYNYHRAWLLNDGSYLYVGFTTQRESNKDLYKEIECDFGGNDSPALKTRFNYPEEKMAGHWSKDDGEITLQIYGEGRSTLFRFRNEDTSELKYGNYDDFWETLRVWGIDESGRVSFSAPDEVTVTGDALEEFEGTYARIETDGGEETAAQPDGFRGEWENDTIFCILRITRGGVSIARESSWSSSGYEETEDGLVLAEGEVISWADDGGLEVDGIDGTFYRVGEGKGVDRYAEFAPFKGDWENPTARIYLSIQDGAYGKSDMDMDIDNISFGMGGASVRDGKLYIGGSEAELDPETGSLTVDGIEGVFVRVGEVPRQTEQPKQEKQPATGGSACVLEAADADLSKARNVIVEPDEPPFNLGGWHGRSKVIFHVDLEEEGDYSVTLLYSKPESDGDPADLKITAGGEDSFSAPLPATGRDWSNYEEYEFCTLCFPAGETTLTLESTKPRNGSYVMNLRSVTLSREED